MRFGRPLPRPDSILISGACCGPSVGAFRTILVAAIAYAVKNNFSQVVLVVHAKGNLDNVISDSIGKDMVKKIQKGPTSVIQGVRLGLTTERIAIPFLGDAVFVAAHTSTSYLKKLEADHKCKTLFYVPWRDEELAEFLVRHQSHEIKADA